MRSKFILIWNQLLRDTGAVTLQEEKFYYILQSLLLNLGLLMNEKLSTINLLLEEPFIECGNYENNFEIKKLVESYTKMLIFAKEHEKQIFQLDDEIKINITDIEEITRNADKILKGENVPAIKW